MNTTANKELTKLQKFIASDKTALVAMIMQGAVLLGAKYGLHLNAAQEAEVGIGANAAITYFVHIHFN